MLTHASVSCVPSTAGVSGCASRPQAVSLRRCALRCARNCRLRQPVICQRHRCLGAATTASQVAAAPAQAALTGSHLSSNSMEVAIPELQHLCQGALRTLGYDDQQSQLISDVCCCSLQSQSETLLLTCMHAVSQTWCFAGATVCSTAQQQQQHGQGHHWWVE